MEIDRGIWGAAKVNAYTRTMSPWLSRGITHLRGLQVREARHEHVRVGLRARHSGLDQVRQVPARLPQRAVQP